MKNRNKYITYIIFGILILFIIIVFYYFNNKTIKNNTITNTNTDIKKYLDLALLDEYKARDTYLAILEKFGDVKPFSNIVNAEEKHINSLESLYQKYNLPLPSYNKEEILLSDTLKDNCKIGIDAEIANASLYKNNLIPNVSNYPDIVYVFTNLMDASQNNHLPAFERCVNN